MSIPELQQSELTHVGRVRHGTGADQLHGTARLGRRTKDLVKRLGAEDIAVIDHRDIDRVSAEELVERRVRAVINVSASTSGRYPNSGPLILTRAGIPLIDMVGAPLFDQLKDGDPVRLVGGSIYANGKLIAEGSLLDAEHVALENEEQRLRIGQAIERFAENTVAHLRQERELLSGRIELPHLQTSLRDRHVLIVVRGTDHKRDLRVLRPYIREQKPAMIGVDGGGDAILEAGLKPDVIVGDMDSASDRALGCGAELVVHAYPDGRAPGRARLEKMDLKYKLLPAPGTSQDVAMLMAFERGAGLIVAVGSHLNLVEFLDKDREGMSSTFITRLRIGEILVDAKGVSRLYKPAPGKWQMIVLVIAALITAVIVVLSSPQLVRLLDLFWLKIRILLGI